MPAPNRRRPHRLWIAIAIGAASGLFTWVSIRSERAGGPASDFAYWWTAARVLVRGGDPYALHPGTDGWLLPDSFVYPLPALFPVLPLSFLPLSWAAAIFTGLSGGILASILLREAPHRLWMFASAPYVMAVKVGQCSPILLAAAFLPALGWLLPWKPQLGIPAFLYRPTRTAALLAAASIAASFVLRPGWFAGWRANLSEVELHPAPVLTLAGPLLLLAVLRWRTPEGRVFLAMICLPQVLFFADQLGLQLVARSRRQSALLAAASLVAFGGWYAALRPGDLYVPRAAPWVLGLVYAPALAVLLFPRPGERRTERRAATAA